MPRAPEIWLAIPSASVELCRRNLPAWRDQGYRIAVLQNREAGDIPADIVRWYDFYPGWAASINLLCAEITPSSADIVVTGGDDMLPDPRRRAPDIAAEMLDHFQGSFGVMQPAGDGYLGARTFCGSPWLGRDWIDRAYNARGPLWPGYHHNWADGELFWVARCLDALWLRDDLSQHHEHFSRTGQPPPPHWSKHVDAHDRADVQHFLARAWLGFPECEPASVGRRFDCVRFRREYDHRAEAHWIARYANRLAGAEPAERLGRALDDCAARGLRRVGIFGAGSHTRLASNALMNPPVEIACVIDDDPAIAGRRLWNYPVVARPDLDTEALDAIILSSRASEDLLADLAAEWSALGIAIIRLYAAPLVGIDA